ncbi:MAG: phosphatidylserine decarboxylase [Erysipelotrichaceae bacterium]|nr:phosphatidylserine decarboxylase [Erysipelotrichaceae bacterium]
MHRKYIKALLCAVLLLGGCAPKNEQKQSNNDTTTDVSRDEAHEEITWDLIQMVEHNDEIRSLLEESIELAHEINPDPQTNPVDSLESYYAFVDRTVRCMPWEIEPYGEKRLLYERIDQSMGCLYFVIDQPLPELKDKDYFHNSIMYHEPFRSWWTEFLSVNGTFLSSAESWNDEYYKAALKEPGFKLDQDLYEDPKNWHSFNDFFARKLKDSSKRPIDEPDDDSIITAPADSEPQGIWQIDENHKIINADSEEQNGIAIKTGTLTDVSVLLKGSQYAQSFANGTLTHTFLDIDDYHRYHFPVTGTVKEVLAIPQDDAPGGVIVWDQKEQRYKEYYSETIGWQSIETRGIVIVETEKGSLVAIVPVGMCQVSSVNFEETVKPGTFVKKGDPLGYFMFGGSDIIMIFSENAGFTMSAKANEHLEMGNTYGRIR